MFSTLVKIEAEQQAATSTFNRYWARNADKFIVAESNQPEEDTTKPSCTLFEAVKVDDNDVFYLTHVQSGGRVLIDGPTLAFSVELNPSSEQG